MGAGEDTRWQVVKDKNTRLPVWQGITAGLAGFKQVFVLPKLQKTWCFIKGQGEGQQEKYSLLKLFLPGLAPKSAEGVTIWQGTGLRLPLGAV